MFLHAPPPRKIHDISRSKSWDTEPLSRASLSPPVVVVVSLQIFFLSLSLVACFRASSARWTDYQFSIHFSLGILVLLSSRECERLSSHNQTALDAADSLTCFFLIGHDDRDLFRILNCILSTSTFYIHHLSSTSLERNFHPHAELKWAVKSVKASISSA